MGGHVWKVVLGNAHLHYFFGRLGADAVGVLGALGAGDGTCIGVGGGV